VAAVAIVTITGDFFFFGFDVVDLAGAEGERGAAVTVEVGEGAADVTAGAAVGFATASD
jgi:hypothetical protein